MKNDLDACNELADSMHSEIKNRIKLQEKSDSIISKQMQDNIVLSSEIEQISILSDSYKSGERKLKITNKFLKGVATFFGITTLVETVGIYISSRLK